MRQSLLAAPLLALLLAAPPLGAVTPVSIPTAIASAVDAPGRPAAERARDRYRHPAQTLAFFGVRPEQNLVEFLPGGGWYTAILAPLVKEKGHYTALSSSDPKAQAGAARMLATRAPWLPESANASIDFKTGETAIPPGSADVVLTFRNVHNLIMAGNETAPRIFATFFRILKPGGVLGVVDHRLPEDRDSALEKQSGYLKRSTIVKLATDAGFRLVAESQINANPRDKADHPKGVWTLPPTLIEGDKDKAAYLAIGESDRMTLRFVKPEG